MQDPLLPQPSAEFVVPASGGRAPEVAHALALVLAAAGVACELRPGRGGVVALHLTGPGDAAGEAAREVVPGLLDQLRAAAAEATTRHIDGRRYGDRMPQAQAAATAPAFRADFTEAWGQAVADLVRHLPLPSRQGRLSVDPRVAAAVAAAESGIAVEHARDLRERSAGRPGRPLRFAGARPLGRPRLPFWSVEVFLRADGPGAAARLELLAPLLAVLRAELDPVLPEGREGIHTLMTGRRNSVRAAVELLPVLLQAAEDGADPGGDVPGYLADFGRAAASRLTAALAELPGAPRDRHLTDQTSAAEHVDRLPEALFHTAAAHFGTRVPLPAAAPLAIIVGPGHSLADGGVDAGRAMVAEVAPGPLRSGADYRTRILTELAEALGVTATDLGHVQADQVPGPDGLPHPHLWRRRVGLTGPPVLLDCLTGLAAGAVTAAEAAAAAALTALDRRFDAGANAHISRAVEFKMLLGAAAAAVARRLNGIPALPAGHLDHGAEAAADRIDADLRAAAALRDHLAEPASAPHGRPRLIIIPCGARKAEHPRPAAQLYTGSYFRAAHRAAAAIAAAEPGTQLLILSARHGLLHPDTVISPYEQKMGTPGSITADQLTAQARDLGLTGADVTVLAGQVYAEAVLPGFHLQSSCCTWSCCPPEGAVLWSVGTCAGWETAVRRAGTVRLPWSAGRIWRSGSGRWGSVSVSRSWSRRWGGWTRG